MFAEEENGFSPLLTAFVRGDAESVWLCKGDESVSAPETPFALLSGSFNPLHEGHLKFREATERVLNVPAYFELSIQNAEKPPLSTTDLEARLSQLSDQVVVFTRADTFECKSQLFPSTIFAVGIDTAERIISPRFYGDSQGNMQKSLNRVRDKGCRFLVAGRIQKGQFLGLSNLKIPAGLADLFIELPESEFRCDVSSTGIRRKMQS